MSHNGVTQRAARTRALVLTLHLAAVSGFSLSPYALSGFSSRNREPCRPPALRTLNCKNVMRMHMVAENMDGGGEDKSMSLENELSVRIIIVRPQLSP
eukprot:3888124-Rhodomonas_salina.2